MRTDPKILRRAKTGRTWWFCFLTPFSPSIPFVSLTATTLKSVTFAGTMVIERASPVHLVSVLSVRNENGSKIHDGFALVARWFLLSPLFHHFFFDIRKRAPTFVPTKKSSILVVSSIPSTSLLKSYDAFVRSRCLYEHRHSSLRQTSET
jgi:hypothetical protein